jgi:hypothetical protein
MTSSSHKRCAHDVRDSILANIADEPAHVIAVDQHLNCLARCEVARPLKRFFQIHPNVLLWRYPLESREHQAHQMQPGEFSIRDGLQFVFLRRIAVIQTVAVTA